MSKLGLKKATNTVTQDLVDDIGKLDYEGVVKISKVEAEELASGEAKDGFFRGLDRLRLGLMTSQIATTMRNFENAGFRTFIDAGTRQAENIIRVALGKRKLSAQGLFGGVLDVYKALLNPYEAKVVRNYNVASFIKEFVVEISEEMNYKAGGYIQIEIPKCDVDYKDIDITSHPKEHPDDPQKFKMEWDKFGLWDLKMKNDEDVERAYSMASFPAEGREIMLNVRIATPPWDRNKNAWMDVNPGIASTYVFAKKPGDTVTISGPYGDFFINESDAEMLYIGGGAGMAPMRSHLYHLFRTVKSGRKVNFWYGGRSKRELFYVDHFRALEKDYPNFKFYIALSEPMDEENWKVKDGLDGEGDGFVGFIHQAVIDNYLDHHESPEDIEVYYCGPPLMNKAVDKMALDYGVPPENIRFDDFGE